MDLLLDTFHRFAPWAFVGFLIGAAWSDVRTYEIPNRFSLLIALLYVAYALTGPAPTEIVGAIIVSAAVFAVAAGLFAIDLMGGGDVKLMAASALWAGPELAVPFVLATAMAGGVLALVVLARIRTTTLAGRAVAAQGRDLPYGVAIAAGGLFVAGHLIGL
jgi:prepilin peptidase CpaA